MVAVASLAVLALLALTMIEATRGSTRSARAELDRARLTAAADAGVALAVQGLAQASAGRRWRPDGRVREVAFDGARLQIRIEDERGKVSLNAINSRQAEALLAAFGLQGAELEEARDAFLDWRDQDELPRPRGRERTDYEAEGVRPRDGPLRSNGELAAIPAIGPELAARIDPFVTIYTPDRLPFDPTYASPLAKRVMAASEAFEDRVDDAAVVEGGLTQELSGRVDDGATGRPLRVIVIASTADGAAARRDVVIELTGNPARPYVVRGRN